MPHFGKVFVTLLTIVVGNMNTTRYLSAVVEKAAMKPTPKCIKDGKLLSKFQETAVWKVAIKIKAIIFLVSLR